MSKPKKETLKEKQARIKLEAELYAEMLYHYKLICRAVGITEDTLKNYRDADQEFSDRLEKGRIKFLHKNIKKARPEFLLERLDPELFKERKESDITSDGQKLQPLLVKFIDKDNEPTNN